MPAHWTDFPERVELFGDLFHILESLDRDRAADVFYGGQFDRECRDSAYHVEPGAGPYLFQPDAGRIPGWDRLATRAEREYGDRLGLPILRAYRGRASEVLDVPLAEVDALSVVAVADALDRADEPAGRAPAADPLAEHRWLRVTDAAKLVARGDAARPRGQVSRWCDDGTFVTNGKVGHERRVDALSVVRWLLAQSD